MEYDCRDDSGAGRFLSDRIGAPERSITSLTRTERRVITDAMRQTLYDLDRFYSIEKASLALFDTVKDRLCITHLYLDGTFKTSITLALPDRRSLLHQIYYQGFPVADNYPSLLAGSVIEKKILTGDEILSVLVVPLVCDGDRLGILSLGSTREAAFSPYLEGLGENIVNRFAAGVHLLLSAHTDSE